MVGSGTDPVLGVIGPIGRWQACQSLVLSLVGVVCGWQVLVISFLAPPTEHWCAPPAKHWDGEQWKRLGIPAGSDDIPNETSRCRSFVFDTNSTTVLIQDRNSTIPCHAWTYDTSEYSNNVIIEWDMVCDRQWLQIFSQAIYMIGIGFGVLFWGVFADRYGRRPTLLLCVMLAFLTGNGCAAVNSVQLFLVFRFMIAFCGIGAYCACFITCMEMLGDWWRVVVGIAFCIPMSLGYMTLAVAAYFIRHWRVLQAAISLPGILYMAYYWVVPESPRWLLSRGRSNEATAIMKRIRQYNKMPVLDNFMTSQSRADADVTPSGGCLELITSCRMLALVICLFFCWFVNSMVFYGILLNTGDFGENIYLNGFLGGVVEVPAYSACIYAILRLGRRWPIALAMHGAGISCLLTLAFDKDEWQHGWPVVCLAMLGRFGITASFGGIYIYSAELFPTSVRNTGLAICSVGSRFGGILSPMLQLLKDSLHPCLPVVVFGLSAIVSGSSILLLPETAGRPLPETVADVFSKADRSDGRATLEEEQRLNVQNGGDCR